jgi:hypothetical protein
MGRRFRMLFEIDGVDAHEEDDWIGTEVRIGEATILINGDVGAAWSPLATPTQASST